ncbi:DUF1993 domain-containing protein [Variovorax sp. YR752]|uniref:DUF1993 domain-containing protein n=1 Tax=Variovorax sp. YR752 TaxID=1884383 RepID=UPI0031379432
MTFHAASVPVFLSYLERLRHLVDAAEAFAVRRGDAAPEWLEARLAADMLPFEQQVSIAAHFALRACFPLAGLPVPPYGDFPATFDGLRQRIARVVELLGALDPAQFEGAGSRVAHSTAGHAQVALPAAQFLLQYALPNFFFHLTTAYAILRQRGVALGKQDFDGFHSYAAPP